MPRMSVYIRDNADVVEVYHFSITPSLPTASAAFNPFITEPGLQITLFSLARTRCARCTHACISRAMQAVNTNFQHLQFDTKRNNLRFYTHGQLCLEQAKVAIA
jgi:hypothetical protein